MSLLLYVGVTTKPYQTRQIGLNVGAQSAGDRAGQSLDRARRVFWTRMKDSAQYRVVERHVVATGTAIPRIKPFASTAPLRSSAVGMNYAALKCGMKNTNAPWCS